MAKKKRRKKGLEAYAEEFAISLIYQATGGKIGRELTKEGTGEAWNPRDQGKLLDSITKLVAKQTPSEDDEEDGISSYRERLNERSGESTSGTDTSET